MRQEATLAGRLKKLNEYNFSFVHEKLKNEKTLVGEDIQKIEGEFRKFMALVLRSEVPLAMIDRRVDEFWHMFILFTPQYRDFCNEVMGFFVHHQPRTSITPVPESAIKNFVDAYESEYGQLGDFWCEGLDEALQNDIRAHRIPAELTFDWSGWTGRKGEL